MAYTRDDYRNDLEIVRLGAKGIEASEAKMRIRLYEAGRYEQLNALMGQECEADVAHEKMLKQFQRIDDDVFQSMQEWLYTSPNNPELRSIRQAEYERKKKEGERRKARLEEQYNEKYYRNNSGNSIRGKLIGVLMFIGGLAAPIGSCAQYGWNAPVGTLWGVVIAAVGAFVFLLNC